MAHFAACHHPSYSSFQTQCSLLYLGAACSNLGDMYSVYIIKHFLYCSHCLLTYLTAGGIVGAFFYVKLNKYMSNDKQREHQGLAATSSELQGVPHGCCLPRVGAGG